MKKFVLILLFVTSAFPSDLTVSVGLPSPGRGLAGVEYGFLENESQAGFHLKQFNVSYVEIGLSLLYFPVTNRIFMRFTSVQNKSVNSFGTLVNTGIIS